MSFYENIYLELNSSYTHTRTWLNETNYVDHLNVISVYNILIWLGKYNTSFISTGYNIKLLMYAKILYISDVEIS